MQNFINKLKGAQVRAGEHNVLGEAEEARLFWPEVEIWHLSSATDWASTEKSEPTIFEGTWWWDKTQWTQDAAGKILSKYKGKRCS